jgi:cation diffusion facilitator CzcD-associated flavoprotein CzcO
MPAKALDVLIIGAGFGGVAMAIRLKKAGLKNFTVLERAPDLGGVWWSNSYPGAACDVESRLYSYSFAQDFEWTKSHGDRDEIRSYFQHCVNKFGIGPHMRFGVEVKGARCDGARAVWVAETADGETFEARALVSACGLFNAPAIPDLSGVGDFSGVSFHSSNWNHDFDFNGKRVAVIGTGCSAAQFVPVIARQVKSLAVFQRTAAWVSPKHEPMDQPFHRFLMRSALLRRLDRWRVYVQYERGYVVQTDPAIRAAREKGALAFLASQVKDPVKRAKLTPTIAIGCKRNIRSSDFLSTLDQPHVDIVTDPIERIEANAIVTSDGRRHEIDALIYGTGFTTTKFLSTLRIVGAEGKMLDEAWNGAPEAYLGVTVAGFPNFFMIYGPNTNAPSSIIFMIECQTHYILRAVRKLLRGGLRSLDVRPETQKLFNDEVQAELRGRAWTTGCRSYFMNAAGRIVTQWHKPSRHYWWRTLFFKDRDYRLEG